MLTTKSKKKHAARVSESASKGWSITNNTSTNIVVIAAYAEESSEKQLYEQSLRVLKTSEGTAVINAGGVATVNLDGARPDSIGTYSIILARDLDLFPVRYVDLVQDVETQGLPALTVTVEDVHNMELAQKFRQTITAFPSSTLATDFASALADPDETKGDAFFKTTDNYRSLTVSMIVAVETYFNEFPFIWADYKENKTYYLYTSDGTSNKYAGSVSLRNKCSAPLGADKPVPGFTISYKGADSDTPETLEYANGHFANRSKSKAPDISLQGLFQYKSLLSGDEGDNTLVTILSGTVGDDYVIGYEEKVTQDKDGNPSGLYALLHPEDTIGWLELAGIIAGVAIGIGVLCKAIKAAIDMRRRLKTATTENRERLNRQLADNESQRATTAEQYARWMSEAKSKVTDLILKDNKSRMDRIIREQQAILEEVVKFQVNAELEQVASTLDATDKLLSETETCQLGGMMDGLMKTLEDTSVALTEAVLENEGAITGKSKRIIEESGEAIRRAKAIIENNEEKRSEWEEDEIPEDLE